MARRSLGTWLLFLRGCWFLGQRLRLDGPAHYTRPCHPWHLPGEPQTTTPRPSLPSARPPAPQVNSLLCLSAPSPSPASSLLVSTRSAIIQPRCTGPCSAASGRRDASPTSFWVPCTRCPARPTPRPTRRRPPACSPAPTADSEGYGHVGCVQRGWTAMPRAAPPPSRPPPGRPFPGCDSHHLQRRVIQDTASPHVPPTFLAFLTRPQAEVKARLPGSPPPDMGLLRPVPPPPPPGSSDSE